MKNKCSFIIPYFGKFPETFSVFLKSCESNTDFHWQIFTDDHSHFDYPPQVQVHYIEYEVFKKKLDEKFGFHVALDSPYKLCDLKPAYGFIFEEYLAGYDFWGHCDIDIVLGDMKHFITDDILDRYDKLYCLGHLILYRNTKVNNRIFMRKYKGEFLYEKVFKDPNICWFDEEWKDENNINRMFETFGLRVLTQDDSANFDTQYFDFRRIQYVGLKKSPAFSGYLIEGKKDAIYFWQDGQTFCLERKRQQLIRKDFLYIHLQQRKMTMEPSILNENQFGVIPNGFIPIRHIPSHVREYRKIRKRTEWLTGLKMHMQRLINHGKRRVKEGLKNGQCQHHQKLFL